MGSINQPLWLFVTVLDLKKEIFQVMKKWVMYSSLMVVLRRSVFNYLVKIGKQKLTSLVKQEFLLIEAYLRPQNACSC